MPAMPMADSSAPMVVGIRHTSSATSTMIDCSALGVDGERLQRHDGQQEDDREAGQQDVEGDLVRGLLPVRALRPGRSCGRGSVSPGFDVICTTIWSDSTRVPPVTAERSPPDSRMTGADSPVMADSSTEAMPSTTSPSPGISSPGRRRRTGRRPAARVDGVSSIDAVGLAHAGHGLGAGLAQRVGLRLAPALGHGLGEVGEQHGEPQPRARPARRTVVGGRRRWPEEQMVVSTLPTSTTNMTGFRAIWRGSSLTNVSTTARRTMAGSNSDVARARVLRVDLRLAGSGGSGRCRDAWSCRCAPRTCRRCSTTGPSARTGK